MSGDPNNSKDLMDGMLAHTGWFGALAAVTWAAALRVLIGRYQRREKESKEWIANVNQTLIKIDKRLDVIEARSHNRRRGDPPNYGDDTR